MRAPDGEPGRELFSFSSLPWILCARGLIPPEEKRDALGDCADAVEDVGVAEDERRGGAGGATR
jgi:hypothetical protein